MNHASASIGSICSSCGLPMLPRRICSLQLQLQSEVKPEATWPTAELEHPIDDQCEDQSGRVLFVVDCLALQQVALGLAILKCEMTRPLMSRISTDSSLSSGAGQSHPSQGLILLSGTLASTTKGQIS